MLCAGGLKNNSNNNNNKLGRKISEYLGDSFDSRYFFQRASMLAIQRYNSILFHETFLVENEIDT